MSPYRRLVQGCLHKACVRVLTEGLFKVAYTRLVYESLQKACVRLFTQGLCKILTERKEGLHKACVRYLQNAKKAYTRLV